MMQLEALLASLVSPQFVTDLDDDVARLIASGDEAALVAHHRRDDAGDRLFHECQPLARRRSPDG